ncbi:MAG TPA: peptide ABC transporter substrate-binding protein [Candidatus Eremiobacteraceae bacterium]|nr:peptide ABC transporter substrate-binding protein [Candidatus Eremiobacteraceae bacterium]
MTQHCAPARLALGLAVCLILSACSRQTSAERSAANPGTIPGVLRIASQQQPETMSTLTSEQYIDTDLSMLWASYLFLWSDKNELVPDLATEVPTQANGGISVDGKTVTYHLRRNVVWHDGAPFTAKDVVFTWHAIMNPRNVTGTKVCYALIKTIASPDDHTIVVRLKRPYSPFVATFFSMANEAYSVLPAHVLSKYRDLNNVPFNVLPIGTGPFVVVSNEAGKIRFVANRRYWRGPPRLREIDFEWLPDDASLVRELAAHRVDLYLESAQSLEPELHGIPGTTIYLYPFTRFSDIGFNLGRPQLADIRVRRALAYATDRTALIDRVSRGVNLPADSDQPRGSWAHANGIHAYPYDPGRAASLLSEAGWKRGADGVRRKDGRQLVLLMIGELGSATALAAETEIAREWRAVGVQLRIKNYPSAQLYATKSGGGIQQNGRFDVTFEQWGNGVDPDDSQLFDCDQAPPAGWNIYFYCDRALDRAEERATTDYSIARRKRDYAAVQRILAADLPIVPVWFVQRQDIASIDLRGYRPANAVSPLWNSWEWQI